MGELIRLKQKLKEKEQEYDVIELQHAMLADEIDSLKERIEELENEVEELKNQ